MFTSPIRCCTQFRHMNGVVAISNNQVVHIVTSLRNKRSYSRDKECCPDVPQAVGKKVEVWPKAEAPPPAWRCECPKDPQPPNYDPYRIKVPDVVVPPLPTGNVKEIPNEDVREPFKCPELKFTTDYHLQDLFHDSPIVHPDYWKDTTKRGLPAAVEAGVFHRLGYHGKSKYKYAFHEPWKPLDRVALIAQAEKEELLLTGAIDASEDADNRVT